MTPPTRHAPPVAACAAWPCQDFGQRVQYSVFECDVDPAQWAMLRARLLSEIDPDHDSLRFYRLGANWRPKVEHVGAKPATDFDAPLII